jgi:hypothetical protein
MAYLRKERETVEMDYSLDKVWIAIQNVLKNLRLNIEQIDETKHHIKAKTKTALMAWGSVFLIDAVPVNMSTTKVSVTAETPVTTITSVIDFGLTKRRINVFLGELSNELTS